jgi:hypothetical protein
MSSPGIRPRNNQPAAGRGGKVVSEQKLRVLSEDTAARTAAPSIAMPRSKTELTELLAGDALLCVRRRAAATAARPNADVGSSVSGADANCRAESTATLSGQESPASLPQAHVSNKDDLARVIDAWPGLSRNVRAAILAMIRETAAGDA